MIRAIVLAVSVAPLCSAAVELSLGRAVNDETCSITGPATAFRPEDPDVFVRIGLARFRPSDRVVIAWIDPSGRTVQETAFADLPAASRPCLISRLQIAGFAPAQSPGSWTVRASLNGVVAGERTFGIVNPASAAASAITSVAPRADGSQLRLDLAGSGFRVDSVVHVARFTETGGWQYLAAELPSEITGTHCAVRIRALEPGEYVAVIRESNGAVSLPVRFVLSTGRSYRLPFPDGEKWTITQGPNGAFSHWNRSVHAWDIAPRAGTYVVAMRAGVAHTHDLGLRQTPGVRSFGNYITIEHGDGEYSHYAHLASRTFRVRDGERVEAGQRLAVVGNSGYALGPGGGYHVHVHVTREPAISAQSIPFQFGGERPAAGASAEPAQSPGGTVQVAQWWNGLLTVPSRTALLKVRIGREKPDTAVSVHLVSPSGSHYGPAPDELCLAEPEPGAWRISVQGIQSGPEPIAFRVEREIKPAERGENAPARPARPPRSILSHRNH